MLRWLVEFVHRRKLRKILKIVENWVIKKKIRKATWWGPKCKADVQGRKAPQVTKRNIDLPKKRMWVAPQEVRVCSLAKAMKVSKRSLFKLIRAAEFESVPALAISALSSDNYVMWLCMSVVDVQPRKSHWDHAQFQRVQISWEKRIVETQEI